MDTVQVETSLVKILNNKNRVKTNKTCILLDGVWGIGKTYTIENLFRNNEFKHEIILLSIFGKESIQDIENSLVFKLLSASKKIIKNRKSGKYIRRIANDLSNNFLGMDINNYTNMISIEDILPFIGSTKDYIICFDDLERKSDNVDMKSLMGLIERVKVNFDVLVITNSLKMEEDNLDTFNNYKEKVINHEVKLDKWNRQTLFQILKDVEINQKNEIIGVYLENKLSLTYLNSERADKIEKELFNIRVFIKYIELILNVLEEFQIKELDIETLKLCKEVVYNYFSKTKDEIYPSSFYSDHIKLSSLKKILLYEVLSEKEKDEFLNKIPEVRNDIRLLFNSHILNENKFIELVTKIKDKIALKEEKYFINENNIISLISAFEENKILDKAIKNDLLKIATEMYIPEYNIKYIPIKTNIMDKYNFRGEKMQSSKNIISFIDDLNENCEEKFKKNIENEVEISKQTQNYQALLQLINHYEINNISEFEEIFDYFFKALVISYSTENHLNIEKLISATKSEIIRNFFGERIRNEKNITSFKKYKVFDEFLNEKMHMESQIKDEEEEE